MSPTPPSRPAALHSPRHTLWLCASIALETLLLMGLTAAGGLFHG